MNREEMGGRVWQVAQVLLERLEQAAQELDRGTVTTREKTRDGDTETIFEVQKPGEKGIIDRAGLKQLTGILKELQEILSKNDALDTREKIAKIQKMELDLNPPERPDSAIRVSIQEEAENYAN